MTPDTKSQFDGNRSWLTLLFEDATNSEQHDMLQDGADLSDPELTDKTEPSSSNEFNENNADDQQNRIIPIHNNLRNKDCKNSDSSSLKKSRKMHSKRSGDSRKSRSDCSSRRRTGNSFDVHEKKVRKSTTRSSTRSARSSTTKPSPSVSSQSGRSRNSQENAALVDSIEATSEIPRNSLSSRSSHSVRSHSSAPTRRHSRHRSRSCSAREAANRESTTDTRRRSSVRRMRSSRSVSTAPNTPISRHSLHQQQSSPVSVTSNTHCRSRHSRRISKEKGSLLFGLARLDNEAKKQQIISEKEMSKVMESTWMKRRNKALNS